MISYAQQNIDQSDIAAVSKALKAELLTTGPLVQEFEKKLTEIVGAPTVTVTSGTAALHCAYAAIGIKPGDEIITPPITFVATQATAALLGARIVFADVDDDTINLNPRAVENALTKRTRAIVAVDYAGHPAEMEELRDLADRYGIYLISDAAHSLGSLYKNRPVGSIADLTTFSFYATKNITTSEGGAVASTNPDLLSKIRRFARQGLVREKKDLKEKNEGPWHQEVHEFGLNYRLPDVLCALGISQLAKLDLFKLRKQEMYNRYNEIFSDHPRIRIPVQKEYVDPNWHLYPIRVDEDSRLGLYNHLRSCGIGVQVNYIPAYRHPVFKMKPKEFSRFQNSEKFYKETISLPLHASLSESEQDDVIDAVLSFWEI